MTSREPLVAPDVDLRGFGYMPLDAQRLRDSDLAIEASPDVFRASVLLWCAAWHQVPAGSLPAKDKTLADYSRAGARWPRIRAEVMSKWVKCSDGRLYHPVVAEKVREAQAAKEAQRARTKAATEAKRRGPKKQRDEHRDDDRNDDREEHRNDDRNDLQGEHRDDDRNDLQGNRREGKGIEKKARATPSEAETVRARVFQALKQSGVEDGNAKHPGLMALLDAGATPEEFADAGRVAVAKGKGFRYALAVVEGRRKDAAIVTPAAVPPAGLWWETRGGCEAKAAEIGLPKWSETEPFNDYRDRVKAASREREHA